jgi:hypothetical protein
MKENEENRRHHFSLSQQRSARVPRLLIVASLAITYFRKTINRITF